MSETGLRSFYIWADQAASEQQKTIFDIFFERQFAYASNLSLLLQKIKEKVSENNSIRIGIIISSKLLPDLKKRQQQILGHPNVHKKVLVFTLKGTNKYQQYESIVYAICTDDYQIRKKAQQMEENNGKNTDENFMVNSESLKPKSKIKCQNKTQKSLLSFASKKKSYINTPKSSSQSHIQHSNEVAPFSPQKTSQSYIKSTGNYPGFGFGMHNLIPPQTGTAQMMEQPGNVYGNQYGDVSANGYANGYANDYGNGYGNGYTNDYGNLYGNGHSYFGESKKEYKNLIYFSEYTQPQTALIKKDGNMGNFHDEQKPKKKKNFDSVPSKLNPQHVPFTQPKFATSDEEDFTPSNQMQLQSNQLLSIIKKKDHQAEVEKKKQVQIENEKKNADRKKKLEKQQKMLNFQIQKQKKIQEQESLKAITQKEHSSCEVQVTAEQQKQILPQYTVKQVNEKRREDKQQQKISEEMGNKKQKYQLQKAKEQQEKKYKIMSEFQKQIKKMKEKVNLERKQKDNRKLFQGKFFQSQTDPQRRRKIKNKKQNQQNSYAFCKKVEQDLNVQDFRIERTNSLMKRDQQEGYLRSRFNKVEGIWIDPNNDSQYNIKKRIEDKCRNFKIMMETQISQVVTDTLENNPNTLYILIYSNAAASKIYTNSCYPFANVAYFIVYCGNVEAAKSIDKDYSPVGDIFVTNSLHLYIKKTVEIVENLQKKIGLNHSQI